MKSILDRSFKYTPSQLTDLKATFARVRKEQRMRESDKALSLSKVSKLPQARKA